jgi:hypothetical protein
MLLIVKKWVTASWNMQYTLFPSLTNLTPENYNEGVENVSERRKSAKTTERKSTGVGQ